MLVRTLQGATFCVNQFEIIVGLLQQPPKYYYVPKPWIDKVNDDLSIMDNPQAEGLLYNMILKNDIGNHLQGKLRIAFFHLIIITKPVYFIYKILLNNLWLK